MALLKGIKTDRRKSTKIDIIVNCMCMLFLLLIAGWGFAMYANQNRVITTQREIVTILAALKISDETRRSDVNKIRCDFDAFKTEINTKVANIDHKITAIYYKIFPGSMTNAAPMSGLSELSPRGNSGAP